MEDGCGLGGGGRGGCASDVDGVPQRPVGESGKGGDREVGICGSLGRGTLGEGGWGTVLGEVDVGEVGIGGAGRGSA